MSISQQAIDDLLTEAVASTTDASSAEEEQNKRTKQRRRAPSSTTSNARPKPTKAKSTPVAIIDVPFSNFSDMAISMGLPEDSIPEVRGMDQIQTDYPHLGNRMCDLALYKMLTTKVLTVDPKRLNKTKASPQQPQQTHQLSTEEVKAMHAKQAAIDPWAITLMQTKFNRVFIPTFYHHNVNSVHDKQEDLHKMLRRKILMLPMMSAQLESALLVESGPWQDSHGNTFHYPPCINGSKCVACVHQFPGHIRPVILTAMMTESEFVTFTRTRAARNIKRPCILCLRDSLVDWITYMRSIRTHGDPKAEENKANPQLAEEVQNPVYQLYYNLTDCAGGYFAEHMTHPLNDMDTIIEPIARLNRSLLLPRLYPNGQVWIDQSAIIWSPHPASSPTVGQNMASF